MNNQNFALIKPTSTTFERSSGWSGVSDEDLKRRATKAARDRDLVELVGLVEAYLLTVAGRPSSSLKTTLANYASAIKVWLEYSGGVSLLEPPRNHGITWVASLRAATKDDDRSPLFAPSTIALRIAAVKTLYKALRWTDASDAEPMRDTRAPKDQRERWERRISYRLDTLAVLFEHATLEEQVLVLLCADAGLRVFEAVVVSANDVVTVEGTLSIRVRHGKGGKARIARASLRLIRAISKLEAQPKVRGRGRPRKGGSLLGCTTVTARTMMKNLIERVIENEKFSPEAVKALELQYKGIHALRHTAGTRIARETNDPIAVRDHLGHSSIVVSEVYMDRDRSKLDGVANWD